MEWSWSWIVDGPFNWNSLNFKLAGEWLWFVCPFHSISNSHSNSSLNQLYFSSIILSLLSSRFSFWVGPRKKSKESNGVGWGPSSLLSACSLSSFHFLNERREELRKEREEKRSPSTITNSIYWIWAAWGLRAALIHSIQSILSIWFHGVEWNQMENCCLSFKSLKNIV